MGTTPIRVGIADDHGIVREALRSYLSSQKDMQVAGQAADGKAAIELVRTMDVDVLLLDLSMPHMSGIEALPLIKESAPEVQVVILTGYPESMYKARTRELGATEYLTKDRQPEDILEAIRAAAGARRATQAPYASPAAANSGAFGDSAPHEKLSEREFQVFMGLARGASIESLTKTLGLSEASIGSYRERALGKLGLKTNSALIHYAHRHGLLP